MGPKSQPENLRSGMLLRAELTFVLLCLLTAGDALAVPSFARQTGLSCNVCHTNPPELTAFGRNFKLKGYVLTAPEFGLRRQA
jgi:hypothetical protein